MSAKKKKKAPDALRDRIRQAAGSLKERAKGMNGEEEKKVTDQELGQQAEGTQDAAKQEEPEQEAPSQEESLREALAKATAERDEYLDLAQRKQAEFANYRRRTEGVRKEAYDDGRRDAIEQLLPVVDNLERALAAAGEEESSLKSGVEMVLRQTKDALAKMGVEELDPTGQPFDAELMNAVMQGTSEEGEPGTVCAVFQKGYTLAGRVIRHAMVKVVPQ